MQYSQYADARIRDARITASRAGRPFGIAGDSPPTLHRELELLVSNAGLTPAQALASVTLTGARAIGVADQVPDCRCDQEWSGGEAVDPMRALRLDDRRDTSQYFVMPTVVPDPARIKSFQTSVAYEKWRAAHHNSESEIWLKIYKKGSGLPTVDHVYALDVALCWGRIDDIRKSFDEQSFLQRFTPRTPKSIRSQVNREHVARFTMAGRMTAHGQRQVDAAKADGRWDAAYAPIREMSKGTVPADLRAVIEGNARALKTFQSLGRQNLFSLIVRTSNMKTPAGRAKKIASLVAMLARGETIYPERKK